MMNVSGALSGALSAGSALSGSGALSGGAGNTNPQIKALEKKIQQLNKEKKEAEQNHNADKVKELEKEIQAAQQKLERLKQKDNQKKTQEEEQKKELQKELREKELEKERQKQQETQDGQPRETGRYGDFPDGYGIQTNGDLLGVYLNRLA